jgi:ER degradation enhancer, mannosidase alpha-like 1
MSNYLPVPAAPNPILNPPHEIMLRFATVNFSKSAGAPVEVQANVFLHAMASTATFGQAFSSKTGWIAGTGSVLIAQPRAGRDACAEIEVNVPRPFILLAERGNCTFFDKAINAHQAGAFGLIVSGLQDGIDELIRPSAEFESPEAISILRNFGVAFIQNTVGEVIRRMIEVEKKIVAVEIMPSESISDTQDMIVGEKREGRMALGEWEIWNIRVVEPP